MALLLVSEILAPALLLDLTEARFSTWKPVSGTAGVTEAMSPVLYLFTPFS